MIVAGHWSKERIVLGSVNVEGKGCILKQTDFIQALAKTNVKNLDGKDEMKKEKKQKKKAIVEPSSPSSNEEEAKSESNLDVEDINLDQREDYSDS